MKKYGWKIQGSGKQRYRKGSSHGPHGTRQKHTGREGCGLSVPGAMKQRLHGSSSG